MRGFCLRQFFAAFLPLFRDKESEYDVNVARDSIKVICYK